jgi:hypothetical protein
MENGKCQAVVDQTTQVFLQYLKIKYATKTAVTDKKSDKNRSYR